MIQSLSSFSFTSPSSTYPLSLHDALPICLVAFGTQDRDEAEHGIRLVVDHQHAQPPRDGLRAGRAGSGEISSGHGGNLTDRKSTRLNSSHVSISYAVFCLKKKK